MSVDEATNMLKQGWKHLASATALADRILADTPRTAPYQDIRRAARYIQSGVIDERGLPKHE